MEGEEGYRSFCSRLNPTAKVKMGSARLWRASSGVPPELSSHHLPEAGGVRKCAGRSFRRDAENHTPEACAPRNVAWRPVSISEFGLPPPQNRLLIGRTPSPGGGDSTIMRIAGRHSARVTRGAAQLAPLVPPHSPGSQWETKEAGAQRLRPHVPSRRSVARQACEPLYGTQRVRKKACPTELLKVKLA
jgi:hypothetical protein